ncbi:similar to Saccharomyces cerevisiae YNL041C COG6 Component of the conserved oligomeric Golgi complex (Cog1p through Cog8p) [Maudiozyma barnettii]|uniref:Conserved oligomeric Golgi complex subunit 6 n=1 Tax=Maudiozyma barnettii TaxID=61262 RepID=A0A8H2VCR1_9SACH|nr:Golgi transport complex subunit COG6 [Kazachstania barnettii]CAB4252807.1 similar to Saccharomyces cerevisiae YNL041C COG6 Component of the conserved oligomeric Golgi complex (Cog1p through Cog8p) [Kazachstania barnettii]CAD1780597.1 similar to Saccharomyces cerevisiae YNL041C COG6 Component of the conserved oligomeric Golgi complex (Cog1p through Cog8p) [Kazachstania barnettii]
MEFIDYQDFSVADTIASELPANDALPEPMQRLNLSTYIGNQSTPPMDTNFKLPDIIASDSKFTNVTLYDKMSQYAAISIKALNSNDNETKTLQELDNDNLAKIPSTKNHDSNKIARDLNNMVSGSSIDLKSLDTKNLVLSKKLSKILNDYSSSNYNRTIELKRNLKFLEENKNNISLDREKLISPEYTGTLSRKTLRSDIENEVLKEHIKVLEEFRPIIRRMKRFSGPLEKIRDEATFILSETQDHSKEKGKNTRLLNTIDSLRNDMEFIRLKKQLFLAIKEKFTLNQVEDDIIINGKINNEYFDVLNKVIKINEHATYLLALPKDNAGSALINKVNKYNEIISKKFFNYLMDFIYNFESNEPSAFDRQYENIYDTKTFQRALVYLSNDLEYFQEFVSKVTSARSKSFLDKFLSQFDINKKKNSDIKPIVLSAHDPIRYISDVLASVHSLIANEADFVKSLFKFQYEEFENTPKSILQENQAEFLKGLDVKLLNEIVQSISNTCRIRIEQIIRFEESDAVNFEIVQLLELYHLMFVKKGIVKENELIKNIDSLKKTSNKKIKVCFTKFLTENIKPIQYGENSDLLQPDWLSEYLNKLVEFFELYERRKGPSSFESDGDGETSSDEENTTLDQEMLVTIAKDPFSVTLVKQLNDAFPQARKNEHIKLSLLTVEINCFDLIKTRLQPFKNTILRPHNGEESIFDLVNTKLKDLVSQMKEVQSKFLFESTGLGMYNNLFNMIFPIDSIQDELDYDMYLSLNENPLMNLDTINENVHHKLNEYLPQAMTDIQEKLLFKLTSPSIADEISENCFEKLSKFYGIFQRILIHLNPDDEQRVLEILNFSPIEFHTLLGLE